MTPREFRQEQNLEFDHFLELTSTGVNPNYVNIELFAHEYHEAKLKLLGIADVSQERELLEAYQHFIDWNEEHDRKASTSKRIDAFIASNCA